MLILSGELFLKYLIHIPILYHSIVHLHIPTMTDMSLISISEPMDPIASVRIKASDFYPYGQFPENGTHMKKNLFEKFHGSILWV